jgi:hypothetical protein
MLAKINDADFCELRMRQLCAFAQEVILLSSLVLAFQELFSELFKKRQYMLVKQEIFLKGGL